METNQQLSRKEREKLFKRKEIMDAAIKLFAKKGFVATTLDDIAVAAEFGKGTIYNYFENKDEIINTIIEDVLLLSRQAVEEADRISSNFKEFIINYVHKTFHLCIENQDSYVILIEYYLDKIKVSKFSPIHNEIMQKMESINKVFINRVNLAIESSEIKKVNPVQMNFLFHNMIHPYAFDWIFNKELNAFPVEEIIDFIVDLLFNGIENR